MPTTRTRLPISQSGNCAAGWRSLKLARKLASPAFKVRVTPSTPGSTSAITASTSIKSSWKFTALVTSAGMGGGGGPVPVFWNRASSSRGVADPKAGKPSTSIRSPGASTSGCRVWICKPAWPSRIQTVAPARAWVTMPCTCTRWPKVFSGENWSRLSAGRSGASIRKNRGRLDHLHIDVLGHLQHRRYQLAFLVELAQAYGLDPHLGVVLNSRLRGERTRAESMPPLTAR